MIKLPSNQELVAKLRSIQSLQIHTLAPFPKYTIAVAPEIPLCVFSCFGLQLTERPFFNSRVHVVHALQQQGYGKAVVSYFDCCYLDEETTEYYTIQNTNNVNCYLFGYLPT